MSVELNSIYVVTEAQLMHNAEVGDYVLCAFERDISEVELAPESYAVVLNYGKKVFYFEEAADEAIDWLSVVDEVPFFIFSNNEVLTLTKS